MSCFWSVKADAFWTCRREQDPDKAELVCVIPKEHRGKAALVPLLRREDDLTFFWFQQCKFTLAGASFAQAKYPDDLRIAEYWNSRGLVSIEEVRTVFGKNTFDVPKPTFIELFKEHAVAPFFVFQVFCVGLWCLDEYWYYSVFTLFMLVVFESTVVYQRLRNIDEFRTMAVKAVPVQVYRSEAWTEIPSDQLLPGDICSFEFGGEGEFIVPADMLLLGGAACIVNEAMISGESTPLMKEPVFDGRNPGEVFSCPDGDGPDRAHVLFAGTKVMQVTGTSIKASLRVTDPPGQTRVIAFVMRTGFGTLQGKLVRTMMFSAEQVSANNMEAFGFIAILLVFALLAAGYVLVKGAEDPNRSRYKLLLECALIITAVVPPELPMELSMAVNTALMALSQFAIFCMEPFRIPLAGKIDICCFDKTGTLTSENLDVEGMAGVRKGAPDEVIKEDLPKEAALVSAVCHSLFVVKDAVAGDPMERVALEFVKGRLVSNEVVQLGTEDLHILHRFPFSSTLKRMSCITQLDSKQLFVASKGAPEVMKGLFSKVPDWYDSTFTKLAHDGARVLALGFKPLQQRAEAVRSIARDRVESSLEFVGFLVFRCPLKRDSKGAVRMLIESGHKCVMITGDNALTAVYTARELELVPKPVVLIEEFDDSLVARALDSKEQVDLDFSSMHIPDEFAAKHDICMLGSAVEHLYEENLPLLKQLLTRTAIFARASPSQKELILTTLKSMNFVTLMCGDGTNDVGALKQAHIGVALLDGKPEDLPKILQEIRQKAYLKQKHAMEDAQRKWKTRLEGKPETTSVMDALSAQMNATEDEGRVKLGDASVAAPFTSKVSSIHAVCSIIRQGRCTLVTTIQMYKILALNSLISAFSLSVLHLKGIRYGDFQVTITGMLLAGCFLFLSRGQPIKKLAHQRPQSNIFNPYLLISVFCQFLLHIATIIYVLGEANRYTFPMIVDEKVKFTPNLVNTAVYLLNLLTQVSTFVVNYQGRPFRESLLENRPLRNALFIVLAISLLATCQYSPEFNAWIELVAMPPAFQSKLLKAMAVDFGGCFLIEWATWAMFFDSRPRLEQ